MKKEKLLRELVETAQKTAVWMLKKIRKEGAKRKYLRKHKKYNKQKNKYRTLAKETKRHYPCLFMGTRFYIPPFNKFVDWLTTRSNSTDELNFIHMYNYKEKKLNRRER
jgi:ribosomal protein S8E